VLSFIDGIVTLAMLSRSACLKSCSCTTTS
jgi:hypothetical protein